MQKLLDFLILWIIAIAVIASAALVLWGWFSLNKILDPIWPKWAMIVINILIASLLVALGIYVSKEE